MCSSDLLTDGGRILELSGLSTSSPAIERNNGFDSVVQCRPGISIVEHLSADWTEQGAFRTVDSLLSKPHNEFDCVFAHNDRMAMGARRAAEKHGLDLKHIKFCGIDAMPQKGGGMELVAEGTLFASYTYPTRGDEGAERVGDTGRVCVLSVSFVSVFKLFVIISGRMYLNSLQI